jgi:hypothetical protein
MQASVHRVSLVDVWKFLKATVIGRSTTERRRNSVDSDGLSSRPLE